MSIWLFLLRRLEFLKRKMCVHNKSNKNKEVNCSMEVHRRQRWIPNCWTEGLPGRYSVRDMKDEWGSNGQERHTHTKHCPCKMKLSTWNRMVSRNNKTYEVATVQEEGMLVGSDRIVFAVLHDGRQWGRFKY